MFPEACRLPFAYQSPVSFFISIPVFDQVCFGIVGYDVNHLCIKNLPYFFANQLIDSLNIPILSPVHPAHYLSLTTQQFFVRFLLTSDWFHQSGGTFQCNTHTIGQCCEKVYIIIRKSIFLVKILQTDHPFNFISGN